jgi:F-type H+-transporting ATPase subunit delta
VLGEFAKQVAAFAERLVAVVTVAGSIDKAQIARIEKSLSANYGHPMTVNVEVDPSILGGVRIQVAGDVIDGSIATRLQAAKLQLA